MWTRKELKARAKEALKRNYWRLVLVSLLLILITGGLAFGSGVGGGGSTETDTVYAPAPAEESISDAFADEDPVVTIVAIGVAVGIFLMVFLIVFALGMAITAVLLNPTEIGIRRFMLKSVDGTAEVKEVAYGFDHSYKNIVKTMFFRDLYTSLWSLLFIIPGIYKSYQYRLVPYMLAETPDMDYREALRRSTELMDGQKWNTFVLDLSFILWSMLVLITCGIAGVFYVVPYRNLTNAALYRELTGSRDAEMNNETPVIDTPVL